jgi:hypothetical protein
VNPRKRAQVGKSLRENFLFSRLQGPRAFALYFEMKNVHDYIMSRGDKMPKLLLKLSCFRSRVFLCKMNLIGKICSIGKLQICIFVFE